MLIFDEHGIWLTRHRLVKIPHHFKALVGQYLTIEVESEDLFMVIVARYDFQTVKYLSLSMVIHLDHEGSLYSGLISQFYLKVDRQILHSPYQPIDTTIVAICIKPECCA